MESPINKSAIYADFADNADNLTLITRILDKALADSFTHIEDVAFTGQPRPMSATSSITLWRKSA